jgi:hypothetical protein
MSPQVPGTWLCYFASGIKIWREPDATASTVLRRLFGPCHHGPYSGP